MALFLIWICDNVSHPKSVEIFTDINCNAIKGVSHALKNVLEKKKDTESLHLRPESLLMFSLHM